MFKSVLSSKLVCAYHANWKYDGLKPKPVNIIIFAVLARNGTYDYLHQTNTISKQKCGAPRKLNIPGKWNHFDIISTFREFSPIKGRKYI